MPKKKQQGYENALQSITDFIFAQGKKKGKLKVRPPAGGFTSTDQLARALAEVATKPGVRITDSMMDAINNSLGDANLIQFWVDKLERINKGDIPPEMQEHPGVDAGGTGRYRPKVKDISKLVKDPRKFVDGVYKGAKAEREWSRKMGFIGSLDGAAALLWAAKNKMPMEEAMRLGYSATYRDTSLQMQMIAHKLVAENSGMQSYSTDKAKAIKAGEDIYEAMNSKDNRINGLNYFGEMRKEDRAALEAFLQTKGYSAGEIKSLVDNVQSNKHIHKSYAEDNVIQASTTGYRDLMITNLTERIKYLDPVVDRAELEKIQRSLSALSMWQKVYGGRGFSFDREKYDLAREFSRADAANKGALNAAGSKITAYESELEKRKENSFGRSVDRWSTFAGFDGAPSRGRAIKGIGAQLDAQQAVLNSRISRVQNLLGSSNLTPSRTAFLQGEYSALLKRLMMVDFQRKNLRSLPWANFRIRMGHISRALDNYKNVKEGGLGGLIIGGGLFFNDAAGSFAPGVIGGQKVYWFNPETKKTETYGNKINPVLVTPNEDLNEQYASLANLYYLTPGSLWKTFLWNGEGFSFLAWRAQNRLVDKLTQGGNLAQINGLLGKVYKDKKEVAANIYEILNGLKGSSDPVARSLYRTLGLAGDENRLRRMSNAGRFIQMKFKVPFDARLGALGNKIMQGVTKLLKGNIKNGIWLKAVDQFGAGMIGIKQLIQQGVLAVLEAIGLPASLGTGGLASVVIGAISYAVTEAAFALSKPLMEVATALVWCILAVMAMLLFGFYMLINRSFGNVTSPYRHVIPGSALACSSYNPHSGMYPDPTPDIPSTGYPPSNSSCPMDFTLYCTQGPVGGVSSYHLKTHAIDIGTNPVPVGDDVWHAPTDGKVVYYSPSNICSSTGKDYGGVLKFADSNGNVYVLMHVKAIVASGPVKKGRAVAVTRRDLTNDGSCWTGPHFHLEVLQNGGWVNAEDWYKNKLKCNLGTCWSGN